MAAKRLKKELQDLHKDIGEAELDAERAASGTPGALPALVRAEADILKDEEEIAALEAAAAGGAGRKKTPFTPPSPQAQGGGHLTQVTLNRTQIEATQDQPLWVAIRYAAQSISWGPYAAFMDQVMCGFVKTGTTPTKLGAGQTGNTIDQARNNLPFPGVDAYALLKAATEVFLMASCGINPSQPRATPFTQPPGFNIGSSGLPADALAAMANDPEAALRLFPPQTTAQLEGWWNSYVVSFDPINNPGVSILPYLDVIRQKLGVPVVPMATSPSKGFSGANGNLAPLGLDADNGCYGILQSKIAMPCMIELIWAYWHEEGMIAQAMSALSMRFQNRRMGARDPLANLEIEPLRPLNSFLWGWIQDEQHRLSVMRRAYEYDHHYGFTLHGKAVKEVRGADSRTKFLEGFHNLLFQCMKFYNEDDDTTRIADGFPVLNSLREVHILLTEGGHNQYGDLPWNARLEMLMMQWILARPEMREWIGGRPMVAYPEPWMDRVDTMKQLQGWTNTNVMHFRDLGVFGEQLLLSIRFGNWNTVIQPQQAANWARYWRAEVYGYVHAYRAATGVDLTAVPTHERGGGGRYLPPSHHLRARLAEQMRTKALPR